MHTRQPHQAEAVTAITAALAAHSRATAVMACGSGKTAVGAWVAEDVGAKTVAVLVPTLALIRQTRNEWHDRSDTPFEYVCVCSDKTVEDDARVLVADLPVVDTPESIRHFMNRSNDGRRKVVFATYQSAHRLKEGGVSFDLIIFDEAHKTTGIEGKPFALALSDENIRATHRLFLTATPRHYAIRRSQDEEEASLIYSMDDEGTYGPIAYSLTFMEAVRRGIIVDYRVAICVISAEEMSHEQRNVPAGSTGTVLTRLAIRKAMEKYPIKKAITFHRSVLAAREFSRSQMTGVDMFHVNGEMTIQDRHEQVTAFEQSQCSVISNARCLTEGVDIPVTDLVVFTSPRRSLVDIVQAAGRAMRRAPNKVLGFILIPVLVESEEELETTLQEAKYDYLWEILRALQETDEALADIVTDLAISAKTGTPEEGRRTIRRRKIDFLGNVPENSFDVTCVLKLGRSDDETVGEYKAYRDGGGAPLVLNSVATAGLHRKCKRLRWKRRHGLLARSIIERLDALGFVWDLSGQDIRMLRAERTRRAGLLGIERYFGHLEKFGSIPAGPNALRRWASQMRILNRKGKLDPVVRDALTARGFFQLPIVNTSGPVVATKRDRRLLQRTLRYIQKVKDRERTKKPTAEVYRWFTNQREKFRRGRMAEEVRSAFEAVGYDLTLSLRSFEDHMEVNDLVRHTREHGNPLKGGPFHEIAHNIRGGRITLTPQQRKDLADAGFLWVVRNAKINKNVRREVRLMVTVRGEGWIEVANRFGYKAAIAQRLVAEVQQERTGTTSHHEPQPSGATT